MHFKTCALVVSLGLNIALIAGLWAVELRTTSAACARYAAHLVVDKMALGALESGEEESVARAVSALTRAIEQAEAFLNASESRFRADPVRP